MSVCLVAGPFALLKDGWNSLEKKVQMNAQYMHQDISCIMPRTISINLPYFSLTVFSKKLSISVHGQGRLDFTRDKASTTQGRGIRIFNFLYLLRL